MFFCVSDNSLLFLSSVLARALYPIMSAVKFVSSVMWKNHNMIISLEILLSCK